MQRGPQKVAPQTMTVQDILDTKQFKVESRRPAKAGASHVTLAYKTGQKVLLVATKEAVAPNQFREVVSRADVRSAFRTSGLSLETLGFASA